MRQRGTNASACKRQAIADKQISVAPTAVGLRLGPGPWHDRDEPHGVAEVQFPAKRSRSQVEGEDKRDAASCSHLIIS